MPRVDDGVIRTYHRTNDYDPAIDGPEFPKLRALIYLTEEKSALQTRLREIEEDIKGLSEQLSEQFAAAGINHVTVDDHTVYLHRQLWASVRGANEEEKHAACAILEEHGLGWMVQPSVNSNTLSAWLREQEEAYDSFDDLMQNMPEDLKEVLKISEVYSVRSRKAGN